MKSGQDRAPKHQGACQGEESWVSQGLGAGGGIWVQNGDSWRRERKGNQEGQISRQEKRGSRNEDPRVPNYPFPPKILLRALV